MDVEPLGRERLGLLLHDGGFELGSLSRDQKQALREDVDRIKGHFGGDFDRSGLRGFALFSSSLDNLWREVPLPCGVGDDVRELTAGERCKFTLESRVGDP